ncbi:hypothetical protein Acid345_0738 [Candidatus Koribacter versatilis Ellin345]|uniref:Uncharacterized protein n=2 Tax=Candidatus Korobacter versatilis TaxID=658062 RepID=Q1ITQ7_KORVE|nr:hypothetical protein Acid345_0738 [Candidatus Koribacter versatilis Ellin345]
MQNFMLLALLESIAATFLFAAFLLPPGFLLAWFSNLFGFRAASGSERLLISAALSIAMVPTLSVLMERFAGTRVTLALFVLAAVGSAALLAKESRGRKLSTMDRSTKIGLIFMIVWAVIALFSTVDLQIGDRLYPSTTVFDHSVRVPFVAAAIRDGSPPLNPFFNIGGSPTLRYYYYWYVVAALPGQLARIPARACLNGSLVWAGFGLASLVPLFLKHFTRQSELRRKSLIGIALLSVTGLDLVAFTILCSRLHYLISDMEWWDPNQVTSWMGSLLWVPHHVAALIACMTGLLVLFVAEGEQRSRSEQIWAAILGGMAFASAAGLSLYVTFTFAVFCALWMLVLAVQQRFTALATWTGASALSLLFAAPYLRDLLTKSSAAGARFAVLSLRDFPAAIDFLSAHGVQSAVVLDFAKIPIVALVYIIEFGFFFCVAVIQFRREALGTAPMERWQRCTWLLLGSCLFVVTIFKSDVTNGNDLGFRGILPAQFVLLIWAAPIASDLLKSEGRFRGATKSLLHAALWIGVLGTICQVALLRGFVWYVETNQKPRAETFLQLPNLGAEGFYLQQGLAQLNKGMDRQAIYQFDAESAAIAFIHLYADHPFAAGDPSCGAAFGGDPSVCEAAIGELKAPYRTMMSLDEVDAICDRYNIRTMIATDLDPIWQDQNSWVWQRQPLVANQRMRALPCGPSVHEQRAR